MSHSEPPEELQDCDRDRDWTGEDDGVEGGGRMNARIGKSSEQGESSGLLEGGRGDGIEMVKGVPRRALARHPLLLSLITHSYCSVG